MLERLKEYIVNKYKLIKCELNIDLKISSDNVDDTIIVSPVDDYILIKYSTNEIKSDKRRIYKDLTYLLEHLSYVFFISKNNDILHEMVYDALDDTTLIDEAEDYIWKNHNNMDFERIFVISFSKDYSFEATVSGSFIDTYWPIFDEPHYHVIDAAISRYKYRNKGYATRYKALLQSVISSSFNLDFLRKYFLDTGYVFLLDFKQGEEEEIRDVYQMIDIDFDNCKSICGDKYAILSSDYESMIVVDNDRFFVRGKIAEEYPTIEKIIQVDDMPCRYIHNLKTSRILYNDKMYEASGKNISDCLNKLNKMLDYKIVCCFTCKYGNYLLEDRDIYCMHSFHPKDLADLLYIVDETKMIPYDQFNLCEDYRLPDDEYRHSLHKVVMEDE